MAKTKSSKATMTRRGVTYKIERNADGTFGRFIPTGKSASSKNSSKKATGRKASAKTSSRRSTVSRSSSKSSGRRSSR
jgi:hypothetical protein